MYSSASRAFSRCAQTPENRAQRRGVPVIGRFVLVLLDMLRLRAAPQDVPPGWLFAATLTLAYVAQGFIADQLLGDSEGAPRSLLAITCQFVVVAMLLKARGFRARLPQTLTALAGTGFIFGLLSLMILSRVDPDRAQPDLALFYLILFGWSLVVDAHIYRHAMAINMSLGVLVAVLIFALNFIFIETMFTT